jgi:hypothetical protein
MIFLGSYQSKSWGTVNVLRGTYLSADGPTAISLALADGEPLATLSVNLDDPSWSRKSSELPADCFYVKTWGGNEDLVEEVLACGLFKFRGDFPEAVGGHGRTCIAPVWQVA